ncbi:hypothetical protein BJ980_000430 [Nocardioides daedukensis]|uniref:Trypsin-like serine protease n=1 Tax=Nocardioides daedukensis TaxID=634462 RepID=A0A7Y9UNU0_9ACTN|nr:S1 family peptidase [Nocardioides daedukensis]NYG57507.1 hypothetical protein [Nocardioides daedukensis]
MRYGSQYDFQLASWTLLEKYPESYAGMRYRDKGETAWMGFNDSIPDSALALIRTLPGDVTVEAGDLLPEALIDPTLDKVRAAVSTEKHKALLSFDSVSQTIAIQVQPNNPAPDDQLRSTAERAAPNTSIRVERVPFVEDDIEDSTLRGGAYMVNSPNGSPYCTNAFVMRKISDGLKRISTAGHCADGKTTTYYRLHGSDGLDSTAVSYTFSRWSFADPDIALASSGTFTPSASFYFDGGNKRQAHTAAAGRPSLNTSVCHYGRTSGRACGIVTETNDDAPTAANQVVSDAAHAPGDSGGPWYWGYHAYGVHHGTDGEGNAAFSPVHTFIDFGYKVWTTS